MKVLFRIFIALIIVTIGLSFVGWHYLGSAGESATLDVFVVPENQLDFDITASLAKQKLIKNEKGFQFLMDNLALGKTVKSGGYHLSQNMNAWDVMKKITGKPDLLWVTVSYCPRKEQVGEKLAEVLGWNEKKLNEWNTVYTDTASEYFEGVYYPDTYLIPVDEAPSLVAERFIANFGAKFAPLADEYIAKNIKWTTGLKIASLIAREAAGKSDMKLISGIIWNRLNDDMPLQIDATMQYTLGKNSRGSWWGSIDLTEKQSDSPYNSYKNKGLPPTPICSPNIDAIEAALNPEETDCFFYLHDDSGQIHCAETYKEHLQNIDTYLR